MADRLVKQIAPTLESKDANQYQRFSNYIHHKNIILLGEPGAGKTHLFKHFADLCGSRFVTARQFLTIPPDEFDSNKALFIDALDEKRKGRTDGDTVNDIVGKLFKIKPKQVRFSCRTIDWLGKTDLAAFQAYFNNYGDYTVIALESLSDEERKLLLLSQGISNPDVFISEANNRGIGEFLTNPQNLIMLANVVRQNKEWPKTRKELFEESIKILLTEHNDQHSHFGSGYSSNELWDPAGAICAVRLISDTAGVSLTGNDVGPNFPSYRKIPYQNLEMVLAALGRPLFIAGSLEETRDYVHRTLAEYLGASWLAKQIHKGLLPISRVQTLIGINGHPASELRGLHAWLAVFLSEGQAGPFIDADPYGVLTYGDAASLSSSGRQRLFKALAQLSESDPWFHFEHQPSFALGALSSPDMVETFRTIICSKQASPALRSMVLDALIAGTPFPSLQDDLLKIFADQKATHHEREQAFDALIKIGESTRDTIATIYQEQLGQSPSDIYLRATILPKLYGDKYFNFNDIVNLLGDIIYCNEKLPSDILWSFSRYIPLADIVLVLDNLMEVIKLYSYSWPKYQNAFQVLYLFDRMLLRLFQEQKHLISGRGLWKWLCTRHKIYDSYTNGEYEKVRLELGKDSVLLHAVIDAALDALIIDNNQWSFMYYFHQITLYSIQECDLLKQIIKRLSFGKDDIDKQAFLYEFAFRLSFFIAPQSILAFEALCNFSYIRPEFREILDRVNVCSLGGWHHKHAKSEIHKNLKQEKEKEENIRKFEESRDTIRAGTHLEWLRWIAKVYFARFSGVNKDLKPYERLKQQLGEKNTQIALEGLMACLQNKDIPSFETIIQTNNKGRYYEWWLAIVAGLNEQWIKVQDLSILPETIIIAALAIDLLYVVHTDQDKADDWKNALFVSRPELVYGVYLAIMEIAFKPNAQYVPGLNDLLENKIFLPSFREKITFELLKTFPNMLSQHLKGLLGLTLEFGKAQDELLCIIRKIVNSEIKVDTDRLEIWLAVAYILVPEEFEAKVESYAKTNPGIIWLFRDFLGYDKRYQNKTKPIFNINQMEFIIHIAACHFPNCSPLGVGWSGDMIPSNAADFIYRLIILISTDPSADATKALMRLETEKTMETYRDHVKHALAGQRIKRRDEEYEQPNWGQTVATLSNGAPANVADLHASLIEHLKDLKKDIAFTNTNIYAQFWNVNSYGRPQAPKPENSCRDVLVQLLRHRLSSAQIRIEPESLMVADKNVDIAALYPGQKVVLELKRDYHAEVWDAAQMQLERFYTRDPESKGFGIYVVFWFGEKRPQKIPNPPGDLQLPRSASEMEDMLRMLIPYNRRHQLAVVVIDVSEPPR